MLCHNSSSFQSKFILAIKSKRQAKKQKNENNLVFIQNSKFRNLNERLMTIDRKNTKISAVSDFYESRGRS